MRPPLVGFFRILILLVLVSACWPSSHGSKEKEKTLAIVKPDGLLGNYTDDVKRTISDYGFGLFKEKIVQLDEDTVKRFYVEHSSKSFFSRLIKYMTSGPVLVMVSEKENAVADWHALMGPTDANKAKSTHPHSIRVICGLDTEKNCVHGSDSPNSAHREISFFFQELFAGSMCFMSGSIEMENVYLPENEVGMRQCLFGKTITSIVLRNSGPSDGFVGNAAPPLA